MQAMHAGKLLLDHPHAGHGCKTASSQLEAVSIDAAGMDGGPQGPATVPRCLASTATGWARLCGCGLHGYLSAATLGLKTGSGWGTKKVASKIATSNINRARRREADKMEPRKARLRYCGTPRGSRGNRRCRPPSVEGATSDRGRLPALQVPARARSPRVEVLVKHSPRPAGDTHSNSKTRTRVRVRGGGW